MTSLHEQSPATYFLRLNNLETFVELVGAKPLHLLSQTVLPLKSPTGAFIASQTRSMCFERSGRGQEPSRGHKFSILENFLSIRDFTSAMRLHFRSDLVGVALVGATPLHLACARPRCRLKAPLGLSLLRCASQTRSHPKPCSWFAPDGANSNGVSCLHNFTEELSNRQEVQ